MIKDFLLVGVGSFIGGGMRFAISKAIQACAILQFPIATLIINILGCFLIGIFSGLPYNGSVMSPSTKLILTTGFCGGFTTFSTFMNENSTLMKDNNFMLLSTYIIASLALGMIALLAGNQLSKALS